MFEYTDPVGRKFLNKASVRNAFRARIQKLYDDFAGRADSAFTWLEAFDNLSRGAAAGAATVDWKAFPLTAGAADADIDRNRFGLQDEYVEWRVEKSGSRVRRVTFTTEFPEYYQAFAEVGTAELIAAVKDAIPGADPTPRELFGVATDPDALPAVARPRLFRDNLTRNPWNDGRKGILCLTQGANTLGALFNLVAECGVLQSQGAPLDACDVVAPTGACGPGRASDPRVCAAAQQAVRDGTAVSLKDPAGVRIDKLAGNWQINGTDIDINDESANDGAWKVSRSGRRGVLTVVDGLTVDNRPVATGAQVAKLLFVAADLVTAPDARLPAWARIGNEGQSRGPATPVA